MNKNQCIENLLRLIDVLQKNSISDEVDESCKRPFLGPICNSICYNTRPITFYKKDGTIFTANYEDANGVNLISSIFRIENVKNGCVTLRILTEANNIISSTNQFITINTNCICAVKCLNDVVVENL